MIVETVEDEAAGSPSPKPPLRSFEETPGAGAQAETGTAESSTLRLLVDSVDEGALRLLEETGTAESATLRLLVDSVDDETLRLLEDSPGAGAQTETGEAPPKPTLRLLEERGTAESTTLRSIEEAAGSATLRTDEEEVVALAVGA